MISGRRKTVLVTQGAMKHSLAMIQHLSAQGYEVHATVPPHQKYTLAQMSRHTAATYPIEEQVEQTFVTDLLALLRVRSFDVLIPVGYPVTEFVARHADEIGRHVRFLSPRKATCERAGDKLQMVQLAESLGLAAPRTYEVKSMTHLNVLGKELTFPLVMKGRHESGQKIVSYASKLSELESKYQALCHRFKLDAPEQYPILQEYIPGWGCGFFALYQNGTPKRVFMHRRVREYPVSGGASSCAESFFHTDLMTLGLRMLDHLGWHGVAMVECRFDTRTNRFTLIEVNAKFWGSLELALKAGADFAGDYVRGALGEPLEFSRGFRKVRFQWPFDGDMSHAAENSMARGAVMRDFFNPWVAKGFHWTDPLPTIVKMYGLFCGIVVGIRSKCAGKS